MRIVIMRPGAIGDTLLTFPVIQALKAKYRNATSIFVGNASVLPLARVFGLVDEVADYEDPRWGALFLPPRRNETLLSASWLHAILYETDLVVCWLRDQEGLIEQNLRSLRVKQYIIAPGRPANEGYMHVVERLAHTVHVPMIEQPYYGECLRTRPSPILLPRHSVAIHPGSGSVHKCWSVASFGAVITALWQQSLAVLLLAGPADHQRLNTLLERLPAPPDPSLLYVMENAPLLEVAQCLCQCQGYLGNDSGITHLAALLGVPTVALFGSSNPCVWRPLGRNVCILYSPLLGDLSVSVIMSELQRFINRGNLPLVNR